MAHSNKSNLMNIEHKQEETDNTTKNLVHEIVRECNAHQIEICENFCTYYVKLLMLDPHWQISPEKKLNRVYIQSLVSFIIKKLQLKDSSSLATLQMQQVFRSQCVDKETVVSNFRDIMRSSMEPLVDNILHYVPDENSKTRLFKRINMLLCFSAFMGHWKNMSAISKDSFVALKSVMDDHEFAEFIEMKPGERLNQIYFLHLVVMGIRLFHHNSGRQLADFQDIPRIITRDLGQVKILLQNQLNIVMDRLNLATNAIEYVFEHKYERDKDNPDQIYYHMEMKLPEGITPEDVTYTCEYIAMAKQYEVCLNKIILEIHNTGAANEILSKQNKDILAKLNSIIKFNIGVAATTVFPVFVQLAQTWSKVQDEFLVLALYLQLFQKLNDLFLSDNCNEDLWHTMIGDKPIITNEKRLAKNVLIKGPLKHCELIPIEKLDKLEKESISFLGFCVWAFVETKGALIPGNPNMGVLRWKKNLYVFSVIEAAYIFDHNPEYLLRASYEIIREKPEFINLLNVYSNLYRVRNIEELCPQVVKETKIITTSTQTELHPIPSTIDSNHIWNEWNLYRDATKLADISRCKTHSSQTIHSHFKCTTAAQTTEPRQKGCQTKTDNYTNVETLSNFIFGLRGYRENVQHVIELTRPIDEKIYFSCASQNPVPTTSQFKKCVSNKLKPKPSLTKASTSTITKSDQTKHSTENAEDLNSCLCVNEII